MWGLKIKATMSNLSPDEAAELARLRKKQEQLKKTVNLLSPAGKANHPSIEQQLQQIRATIAQLEAKAKPYNAVDDPTHNKYFASFSPQDLQMARNVFGIWDEKTQQQKMKLLKTHHTQYNRTHTSSDGKSYSTKHTFKWYVTNHFVQSGFVTPKKTRSQGSADPVTPRTPDQQIRQTLLPVVSSYNGVSYSYVPVVLQPQGDEFRQELPAEYGPVRHSGGTRVSNPLSYSAYRHLSKKRPGNSMGMVLAARKNFLRHVHEASTMT